METTIARIQAADAGRSWDNHWRTCWQCRDARKRRAWEHLCDDGIVIWDDKRQADAVLLAERMADAEPVPGQGELF
jgi:hypothetical protein